MPACVACLKAGWRCPGYTKRWKFVDENHNLILTYRKKNYIFEDVDESELADNDSRLGDVAVRQSPDPSKKDCYSFNLKWPTSLPFHRHWAKLCYVLDAPHSRVIFPINSHGSFYAMIPARLGRSDALDDAVSCLCSLYTDSSRRAASASSSSFRLYARSLQSLRRSLTIPQDRTAAETICASIIMQLCELIMHEKGGQWNQLCQGTKLLIQESGPERFTQPFERAMLESQRAWFIVQDANIGRGSFLSQHKWRGLLSSSSSTSLGDSSICLRAQLCDFLVDVPSLIRDASDVISKSASSDLSEAELIEQRQKAVHKLNSLKQVFEWWHCTKVAPLRAVPGEIRSEETREGNTEGSRGDGLLLAVVDCVSHMVLIRLETLMFRLSNDSEATAVSSSAHQAAISARREAMSNALKYVWEHSSVAFKPLEFGLQQLWLDTAFEPSSRRPLLKPLFWENAR